MCVDFCIRPSGSTPGWRYWASLGLVMSTAGHCSNFRSEKLSISWSMARTRYLQERWEQCLVLVLVSNTGGDPDVPLSAEIERQRLVVAALPAIVHPVAQLQLQGALRVSAVQDGHQASQRVQVAAQIRNSRSGTQEVKSAKLKTVHDVTIRQLVQLGLIRLQSRKTWTGWMSHPSLFRSFPVCAQPGEGGFCSLHLSISHALPHLMTSRTPGDGETTVEVV